MRRITISCIYLDGLVAAESRSRLRQPISSELYIEQLLKLGTFNLEISTFLHLAAKYLLLVLCLAYYSFYRLTA